MPGATRANVVKLESRDFLENLDHRARRVGRVTLECPGLRVTRARLESPGKWALLEYRELLDWLVNRVSRGQLGCQETQDHRADRATLGRQGRRGRMAQMGWQAYQDQPETGGRLGRMELPEYKD